MSAEEKRSRQVSAVRMHKLKLFFGWLIALALIGALVIYSRASIDPNNPVVSSGGVHYHAHLAINIDGVDVPVPKGIGLIAGMEHPHQMHTHEADQIIHIEMEGRVRAHDLSLGNFFNVWGQTFTKDNIMGHLAGNGKTITMTVNGKPQNDFDQYQLNDKDEVEITYK